MNGEDLFRGLNYVNAKFIDEAENLTQLKGEKKILSLRRPVLIAAIIAMLLLLVGCTVLYYSSIYEIWVGEKELFYDRHDSITFEYMGRHYYTVQVFSATGNKNSSAYQAAEEWYLFTQEYDPDHTIQKSVWGAIPEFPPEYGSYNIYTQEMKDKLDAIVEKYNLKLVGKEINVSDVFELCDTLGIEQSVISHPKVLMGVTTGSYYENGNFTLSLHFSFRDTLDADPIATWGNITWNRKDCFSDAVITLQDTGDWTEWYYTTSSGNTVLIVRSPSSSRCYMIINRKEAVMSVELETRFYQDWDNEENSQYLTNEQVEQIADVIDASVKPKVIK